MSEILAEKNVNENTSVESNVNDEKTFYKLSEEYWKTQPATVDGMLGGYEIISDIDIQQSQIFLNSFLNVNYKLNPRVQILLCF